MLCLPGEGYVCRVKVVSPKTAPSTLGHGAHLPHLTQFSLRLPKPQSLHSMAGVRELPIHLPHLTQLLPRLPKPQSLQSRAGTRVTPIHLPHLAQFSLRLPKPQSLHKYAGKWAVSASDNFWLSDDNGICSPSVQPCPPSVQPHPPSVQSCSQATTAFPKAKNPTNATI